MQQNDHRLLITCPKGCPPVLCRELEELGFPVEETGVDFVSTRGGNETMMRLNLELRTAHRVQRELGFLEAATCDGYYAGLRAMPWECWLNPDMPLTVRATAHTPAIRDTRFAVLRAKDAIVDRLRERFGRRPDTGPDRAGAVVFVRWHGTRVQVYLDTSGESLCHRGYRLQPGAAPLRETLAAALVLSMEWDPATPFIDPMCGSGTLAIEAALLQARVAPGLLRETFALRHLTSHDENAWLRLRGEAASRVRPAAAPILASDISPQAVAAARDNAARAGVDHRIQFSVADVRSVQPPPGGGCILINPPYAERMGEEEALRGLYGELGDWLKHHAEGYRAGIFTGNLALAKHVGLRTSRRTTFFNGPIECRLLKYELYR